MKKEADPSSIRVLKTGTCPSLSAMSKLTYEIGCGPASDIQVRISKNSGTGYFSADWVTWDDLLRVLAKNAGMPITCHSLSPLFTGRSVNTAGFLLAVLKHEGLVQVMEKKRRCYECLDGKAFITEVQALIGSEGTAPKKSGAKVTASTPKKSGAKASAVSNTKTAAKPRTSKP